jgi:hypothetical protein
LSWHVPDILVGSSRCVFLHIALTMDDAHFPAEISYVLWEIKLLAYEDHLKDFRGKPRFSEDSC